MEFTIYATQFTVSAANQYEVGRRDARWSACAQLRMQN